MTLESFEELRDRLLLEDRVQQMVRVRAYEIYQIRGGQPGWEARDWFQAEGEVLAFLIANESREDDEITTAERASEVSAPEPVTVSEPPALSEAPATKVSSPSKASGARKQAAQKPASKRVASKKAEPKPKTNQTRKSSKKEKSDQ